MSETGTGKIVRFESQAWQDGFTVVPNIVLMNSRLSLGARMMWATLAYYARQSNEAWPGQVRLAASMDVSERTVRTYLRELENIGLLVTRQRGGDSNLYTLLVPSEEYMEDFNRQHPDRQNLPVEESTRKLASDSTRKPASGSDRQNLPTKKEAVEEDAVEEEKQQIPSGDGSADLGGLFSPTGGVPEPLAPTPSKPLDDSDQKVERIWAHYARVFDGRFRLGLTPARRTMILKGLKAVEGDENVCKLAIEGLKSYREQNPGGSQDVSINAIFKTYPGGRNLTDQILLWSDSAPSATSRSDDGMTRHAPADRTKVKRHRLLVVEMVQSPGIAGARERGEQALAWLKQVAHEEPIIEGDKVTGWREVE